MSTTVAPNKRVARTPGIDIAAIVEEVTPAILEYAQQLEVERTLPPALVDVLYDAGVLRFCHPREVGGLEAHPGDWLDLVYELARINGSAGWMAMLQGAPGFILERDVMEEIGRRDGRWLIAGSAGRLGKAHRVAGGYLVSGRWVFASGAPHATYITGLARVYDDNDEVVVDPLDGTPRMISAYLPASEVTLHDDWDGLGLRGTGSCGFSVDGAFVADRFVIDGFVLTPDSFHDRTLYREGYLQSGHSAHALGVARSAIDAFVEQTRRPPRADSMRASFGHQQLHDITIGKADALVRAAKAFSWDAVDRVYQEADANGSASAEARLLMGQSNLFGVRAGRDAVWMIFDQCGTDGVIRGRPLERIFRDASTMAQHATTAETSYASIGQHLRMIDQAPDTSPTSGPAPGTTPLGPPTSAGPSSIAHGADRRVQTQGERSEG